MDRHHYYPAQVGMISVGVGSLHRIPHPDYKDPRFNTSATGCGRWIKSLPNMKIDYLKPTRICQICFKRKGVGSYTALERFVVVEFFEQEALDV